MGAKNSRRQIAKKRPTLSLESCYLAENEFWFPKLNDLPDLALVFDQIIINLKDFLFLISIFAHLPFVDRLSAELVCRRWCRLARDGMSWAKYSVLKNSDLQLIANSKPIKQIKMDNLMARFGKFIEKLYFIKLNYIEKSGKKCCGPLYLEYLPQIIPCLQNLRHLVIDFHSGQTYLDSLMAISSQLKSLHLVYDQQLSSPHSNSNFPMNSYENSHWFVKFLRKCNILEYLSVDYLPNDFVEKMIESSIKFPISLKQITFGLYVDRSDMDNLTKMVSEQCPELNGFEGRVCNIREDTTLLLKNLKYLKEYCFCAIESRHSILRFGRWDNLLALNFHWMDIHLLLMIAQKCPNIEHLGIEQCWGNFDNKSVANLAEREHFLPNLSSFILRDYTAIEAFFPMLMKGTLQYIYLSCQLSMEQIVKLLMTNQKLKELYLDQAFFANDVIELHNQIRSPIMGTKKLFIFCRGYGPDVTEDPLNEYFPCLHICKNEKGNLKNIQIPVLEQNGFVIY